MDFKDYYEIMGVPPNADKKVIQQTFRQLACKLHPDVNPGNKEAEEKFKTINEAYQVLSNAKQRKSTMSYGLNTSNGSRQAVNRNRISTGRTGQLNPAKRHAPNTPMPKTWKTCSEANHHIPIFLQYISAAGTQQ